VHARIIPDRGDQKKDDGDDAVDHSQDQQHEREEAGREVAICEHRKNDAQADRDGQRKVCVLCCLSAARTPEYFINTCIYTFDIAWETCVHKPHVFKLFTLLLLCHKHKDSRRGTYCKAS
jgi:hypothetical protein